MNQMTTFIIVMTGLTVLFYIFGVGSAPLLDLFLNPDDMSTSAFYVNLTTAILAASALVLGLVYKNAELATMTAVVPVVLNVLWCFNEVIKQVYAASPVLALIFFSPIMFYFMVAIVDYWRGRD